MVRANSRPSHYLVRSCCHLFRHAYSLPPAALCVLRGGLMRQGLEILLKLVGSVARLGKSNKYNSGLVGPFFLFPNHTFLSHTFGLARQKVCLESFRLFRTNSGPKSLILMRSSPIRAN